MMLRFLLFLWCANCAYAHIGSPNVFFEGDAGAYLVRVVIRPPRVVPGLAEISVSVKTNGVSKVSVLPARWDTGRKGSPPPDVAIPVKGETNLYSSQLWLMDSGAYSVFVNVEGAAGTGTAIVPVNAIATQRLEMAGWMSTVFLGCGIVLFVMFAALIASAAREGSLPVGAAVDVARRRRGWVAASIAVLFASGLLTLGKTWWDKVDRDFRNHRLFEPAKVAATIEGDTLILKAPKRKSHRIDNTDLVPDHGKLMHLFLIEKSTGRGFAHLHPIRRNPETFAAPLPALAAGKYHVYADVTHESGFNQTWQAEVDLPGKSSPTSDPDDTFAIIEKPASEKSPVVTFPSGARIRWEAPATIKVDEDATLRFHVNRPDGSPAILEPYLGMYAHAVVWREDGEVFTHLHPLGTISMTSQLLFAEREKGKRLANLPLDINCGAPPMNISFPYAFPKPGNYRFWVQFKLHGQVHTAAYEIQVQ